MAKKQSTKKTASDNSESKEKTVLSGAIVQKTRITSLYTEYTLKGEGVSAVIQAHDDAFNVGDEITLD